MFVCGGGGEGFINYMRQILKTLMLILFDKTSLTATRSNLFKIQITKPKLV